MLSVHFIVEVHRMSDQPASLWQVTAGELVLFCSMSHCASVSLFVPQTVQFMSSEDQNVPQWTLDYLIAFLTLHTRITKMPKSFLSIILPQMFWFTPGKDQNVPQWSLCCFITF